MRTLLELRAATTRVPGRTFGPFDLKVAAGERIAVLGPSGAGKSTLLQLIAGARPAIAGQVRVAEPAAPGRATLARPPAALLVSPAAAFGLNVELAVSLGRLAIDPDPDRCAIVAQALGLLQVAHLVGRRLDTLSAGEQARVRLAHLVAQLWDVREGLMLVDEPLAMLDAGLQAALLAALADFCARRGHALVATMHHLDHALSGFERLWLMREGRVIADRRAERAVVPMLADLFQWPLRVVDDEEHDGRFRVLARRGGQRAAA